MDLDRTEINRRHKLLSKFLSRKDKSSVLKCDERIVHVICELCSNILMDSSLNKPTLKKLFPMRKNLHILSNSRGSLKKKREICYEISDELYPILKKTILPIIKKKNK